MDIKNIDPQKTKIELNIRPIRHILLSFKEEYGEVELGKFIESTGMPLEYFKDENNWISYKYFCDLLRALVEYTKDSDIAYKYGLNSAEYVQMWGILKTISTAFSSPLYAYRSVLSNAKRWSKTGVFSFLKIKRNKAVVEFKLRSDLNQDENNCRNIQGQFASIPKLWSLPYAKVKETQCAAKGADSCIYEINWVNVPTKFSSFLGFLIGGVIALISYLFFLKGETGLIPNFIGILLFTMPLFGVLFGYIIDCKKAMQSNISVMEEQNEKLVESLKGIEQYNLELQNKVEMRTQEIVDSNNQLQSTLDALKNSQEQLVQSEKMASVGRLAAGMAHELNNPVGAVRNYIQDMLEDISEDNSNWERLKKAEKATSRCKKIVNDLLAFARQSKELNLSDINIIIEAVILNAGEISTNPQIKILKDLEPNLTKIKIDSLQIQQVLMNLVMNAVDAIKGKGQISIKSSSGVECIYIEISDTGEGIAEDIQDKIFDPFFTTKSPGKGMGLGLALSYNIIKRFNGSIQVKSVKGKGSVFTITFPIEDKTADNI